MKNIKIVIKSLGGVQACVYLVEDKTQYCYFYSSKHSLTGLQDCQDAAILARKAMTLIYPEYANARILWSNDHRTMQHYGDVYKEVPLMSSRYCLEENI